MALVVQDERQEDLASEVAAWAKTQGVEVQVFWSLQKAEAWLALLRPEDGDT